MTNPTIKRSEAAAVEPAAQSDLLSAAMAVLEMCEHHGDFRNGVTDPTGTIDEGNVIASRYFGDLRAAISKVVAAQPPAPQAEPGKVLTNEHIEGLFYPFGTATESQLLIARAIGRAIERATLATMAEEPVAPEGAVEPAKVPLTNKKIDAIRFSIKAEHHTERDRKLVRAVEAAHGIATPSTEGAK